MGHGPRKREIEAEIRAANAERDRQRSHYERSMKAWERAEAKGITWQEFRNTPLPVEPLADDDYAALPLLPWPHPREPG